MVITPGDDDHPGKTRFFRATHGDAVDVVASAAEQARHAGQNPRFIVDEYRDGVRLLFVAHASSSPKIISSSPAPGATIGYTFSSVGMTNSTTTGPGWRKASCHTASASAGVVARIPRTP